MSLTILNAYIGRDFEETLVLEYQPVGGTAFETVADDTVTRAVFKFGDWCIDTDNDPLLITLEENATRVSLKIGLIDGLEAGRYTGHLTIYDTTNVYGVPWAKLPVRVHEWPACTGAGAVEVAPVASLWQKSGVQLLPTDNTIVEIGIGASHLVDDAGTLKVSHGGAAAVELANSKWEVNSDDSISPVDDRVVSIGGALVAHPALIPIADFTISDSSGIYPIWMSDDRRTVFAGETTILRHSLDGGGTYSTVNTFGGSVLGVRQMGNGELLASIHGSPGTLWLSSGYPQLGSGATWTEVLETGQGGVTGTTVVISGYWGMSVYENIAVVSEYGDKTVASNARFVYLSEDYGATWSEILDRGAVDNSHVHGVAYDPWWDAIWVAVGDGDNTATLVSFNHGVSWTDLNMGATQYVSILPMENCILFGTDGGPNGVHRIRRTKDKTIGPVEHAYLFDNAATITFLQRQPFMAKGINMPALFPFTTLASGSTARPGRILATYDGYNFTQIFEDTETYLGKGSRTLVGPTHEGYFLGALDDDRQEAYSLLKGKATPTVEDRLRDEMEVVSTGAFSKQFFSKSGFYVASQSGSAAIASTRTNNVLHLSPIHIPRKLILDRIGMEVTIAGSANSVVRLGIYASDAQGFPDALVIDAGTVDSTGTGFLEKEISVVLEPGLYWLAAAPQGTPDSAATLRCNGTAPLSEFVGSTAGATVTAGTALNGFTKTSVSAALPDPFGGFTGSSGTVVRVTVRIK